MIKRAKEIAAAVFGVVVLIGLIAISSDRTYAQNPGGLIGPNPTSAGGGFDGDLNGSDLQDTSDTTIGVLDDIELNSNNLQVTTATDNDYITNAVGGGIQLVTNNLFRVLVNDSIIDLRANHDIELEGAAGFLMWDSATTINGNTDGLLVVSNAAGSDAANQCIQIGQGGSSGIQLIKPASINQLSVRNSADCGATSTDNYANVQTGGVAVYDSSEVLAYNLTSAGLAMEETDTTTGDGLLCWNDGTSVATCSSSEIVLGAMIISTTERILGPTADDDMRTDSAWDLGVGLRTGDVDGTCDDGLVGVISLDSTQTIGASMPASSELTGGDGMTACVWEYDGSALTNSWRSVVDFYAAAEKSDPWTADSAFAVTGTPTWDTLAALTDCGELSGWSCSSGVLTAGPGTADGSGRYMAHFHVSAKKNTGSSKFYDFAIEINRAGGGTYECGTRREVASATDYGSIAASCIFDMTDGQTVELSVRGEDGDDLDIVAAGLVLRRL